jgi:hypothetical protein
MYVDGVVVVLFCLFVNNCNFLCIVWFFLFVVVWKSARGMMSTTQIILEGTVHMQLFQVLNECNFLQGLIAFIQIGSISEIILLFEVRCLSYTI